MRSSRIMADVMKSIQVPLRARRVVPAALLVAVIFGSFGSLVAAQTQIRDGILTDSAGMTLYWWDNDGIGKDKVACDGVCELSWPPLLAPDGARATGDYTLITRENGKKMWAYKGRPLYRWFNDKQPGDRKGDNFRGNTWHVARP